jgi:catechol 2,3-dioxygenase-like lactoylglutathione lyase family enzyme
MSTHTGICVTRPRLHHVALTVTDLERSVPWYENVFDVKQQMEGPFEGGEHRLLADPEWQLVIVLARHEANRGEGFAESRTGLDHIGLMVASRAELEAWQARLAENGAVRAAAADRPLTQAPILDTPYGSFLTFRDSDNIQLHLSTPPPR